MKKELFRLLYVMFILLVDITLLVFVFIACSHGRWGAMLVYIALFVVIYALLIPLYLDIKRKP